MAEETGRVLVLAANAFLGSERPDRVLRIGWLDRNANERFE